MQHGSGGIADALNLAKEFVNGDKVAVILGDNIFEQDFSKSVAKFEADPAGGAMVFVKKVLDPQRFGVAEVADGKIKNIVEKPKEPKSDLATVGFYIYDTTVFEKISRLKPSARNELEITDVHNMYIEENALGYDEVEGYWSDAGTFDSLHKTAAWVAEKKK